MASSVISTQEDYEQWRENDDEKNSFFVCKRHKIYLGIKFVAATQINE